MIAINEAVDRQVAEDTLTALRNPNAVLKNIQDENQDTYQDCLFGAKSDKAQIALNKVGSV